MAATSRPIGGNFLLTRDFMRQWPARVPGRLFVLTSRRTLSAAMTSIAYLKQAGGSRVQIIGEPVRQDYADRCRKFDDCLEAIAQPGRPHGVGPVPNMQVERLPLAVTLDPDVLAPWTLDAWLTGRDPAMEAVAAMLRRAH